MAEEKPKIIVDSDWKSQARAEKEKLAEQDRAAKERAEQAVGAPGEAAPVNFLALLGTLATQAVMYLGGYVDPKTNKAIVSPEHAQFYIELLEVLEEKTKGNLTEEEAAELAATTHELRMRFVQIMRAVQQAAVAERDPHRGDPLGASGAGPVQPN